MNKITLSGIKCSAIALGGTFATMAASTKVTKVVYDMTDSYDKACAAGTMVGAAGMVATVGTTLAVAEADSKKFTDRDAEQAAKINRALDSAGSGLKTVSNALRVAAFFTR